MENKSIFLSEAIVKLLNYRVEQEEYSSRVYLAMATWLFSTGFTGAGKLFSNYSKEELVHTQKARNILAANGVLPITAALSRPKIEFKNLQEVIQLAYEHEIKITHQCNELAKLTHTENNFMVVELGLWYSIEQVEELNKLQNFKDRLSALIVSL